MFKLKLTNVCQQNEVLWDFRLTQTGRETRNLTPAMNYLFSKLF